MTPLRAAATLVGLAIVVVALARLPADVFAATQAFLLVAAGAFLLLGAAAVVLAPARRAEALLFDGVASAEPGAWSVAGPERIRRLVRTFAAGLVCAAAAMGPLLLR